MTKKIFCRWK